MAVGRVRQGRVRVAVFYGFALQAGATRLLINASDADDTSVAQHLLETSKALMNASLTGIWNKEDAGPEAA